MKFKSSLDILCNLACNIVCNIVCNSLESVHFRSPVAYSEPYQAYNMERFSKTISTKRSVLDV